MRILIYSQDGFGLGHLRRNLNISLQIKKRCPSASILIIADSPVAPFFNLPPKCDFIKIPTIVKVDMGVWRSDRLPVTYKELLNIRSEIIQDVALSFRPHVFLVDHMPNGALGELAGPLQELKKACPQTRLVLGLRDILGAPQDICKFWRKEGAYAAADVYYDQICVYGSEQVFDLVQEYRFPRSLREKTNYCGYVCREPVGVNGHEQGKPARDDKKRYVLVTGGGGKDASYFMDMYINAVRLLHRKIRFTTLLSTGPFMHREQYALLKEKAKGLPIRITNTPSDTIRFLCGADLVISMAGYNTVSEIMCFRKNAIIVPRPGPSLEQTMRSQIMTERGLFSSIHPTKLTPESFAELIMEKLHNGNSMKVENLPDLTGASRVASLLLSNGQSLEMPTVSAMTKTG